MNFRNSYRSARTLRYWTRMAQGRGSHGVQVGHRAETPDFAALDSCRRSPTAPQPARPGFVRGRDHSAGTGWRRWFAGALLIALAAVASGPPAFAQQSPLTAEFQSVPANGHNGVSDFTVHLVFSEATDLSFRAFQNGLLTITGGTLRNQGRLQGNLRTRGWRIDVEPDGNGEVTITLPVSEGACDPASVPCTDDGRPLSAPVSVTVRGQTPWVTGPTSFTAAENQAIPTEVATLTASDTSTSAANLRWSIPAGAAGGTDSGKFTLSSGGVLVFTEAKDFENPDDANTDGIYEVTVQVRDVDGLTNTADLTVTLTDVNEAPTAEAGPNHFAVQPGATVTLSGSGSDPDAGDTLTYAWTQTGSQVGTLTNANTATATFTAPATVTAATTLTFTLRVTDANGLHHEDTVTVTGGQPPQPPVITSASGFEAAENQTAVATLTATVFDTPISDLTWSIPAGAAGGTDSGKFTLSSGGVLAFVSAKDFENPDDADTDGIYEVTVQVRDSDNLTGTADLTVRLANANDAPTADAGADHTGIAPGATVTLSGSGSDPDAGDTLTYAWTQTGSQVGTLTNANTATATFTAPATVTAATTLTFTLRVTDQHGRFHEDSATVTATTPGTLTARFDNAPFRHNGSSLFRVQLHFSENVRLNGSALRGLLTITGGTLTNQRRLTRGSSMDWEIDVTPNGVDPVIITLPAGVAGVACDANSAPCTLDGEPLSAPASIRVRGQTPEPEVTGSTSFEAEENQTAVATLRATDASTSAANLRWSIPAGAAGGTDSGKFTLSSGGVLVFRSAKDFENPDDADTDGIYEVTVQVRDSDNLTGTADLTVRLTNVNEAPIADTGADQTSIAPGMAVTLSGSGSDPDAGDTLSYVWTQAGGATVGLTNANAATATFTMPAGLTETTTFTFTFRVTDTAGLHHEDTVNVMASGPVITSATSFEAAENQTAVATLTATDADTLDAELTWSIPAGTAGGVDGGRFTLSSDGVLAFATPKDYEYPDDADRRGSYEVTVEVSDGALKATADLTVTLTGVNEAPGADTGSNQHNVQPGSIASLTGSGYDPEDRGGVDFLWTQTGGDTVTLTGDNTSSVSFTVPRNTAGLATFTFTLRVTDRDGMYSEDTATVTVAATTPGQTPDPPVVTSATSLTVPENQTAVATLTATDADTQLADLVWSIPGGFAGGADGSKFALSADGVLAFASTKDFENPDNDFENSYEVVVVVSDGDHRRETTLTVTLTDVNEAPTAEAGPNHFAVGPGEAVTLSGSGTDPDAGDTLSYAWTLTGSHVGTLTNANAATATFTAPTTVTEATAFTFTLRVTDAAGLYGEDTVTVTVEPRSGPVITSATSLTVPENQTAVATLTATNSDKPDANLTWSIPAGAAGGADGGEFTLSADGILAFASTQDFEDPDDADTNGIYAVTVEVSDDTLTTTADLTVTLTNINEAPTAEAGADQTDIAPGAVVTLSGSGSDPDAGDTLSYAWTLTGEPMVALTDANAATATFTAPAALTEATTLTFTLQVTDAVGLFHEDTVTVTMNPPLTAQFENVPVNHDRFNQFSVDLRFSEEVDLNAAAFGNGLLTISGGTLRGQRQLTEGSSIAWRIDITPPSDREDVIITLPANRACDPDAAPCTPDGRRLSAEASVTVKTEAPPVLTSNTTLRAAENQTAVATLTATDDETPVADLQWFLPSTVFGGLDREHFTLSAEGVLAFREEKDFEYPDDANTDGRYQIRITITDGDRSQTNPSLTVTLTNVNEEPTADAGPNQNNVVPGATVRLSGSGSSDPDAGDTLSYAWTQTGGTDVSLTDANTATATFTAPATVTEATTLTFTLRVTDAGDLFHEDTMTVTVRPQPPVITSASSFEVEENQTAVAALTATDADTPDADLTWSIPAGAAGGADSGKFTLSSNGELAFASAQDFENPDDADADSSYEVTVEVSDGDRTDTADLTVTLTDANEEPTADAGADQADAIPGTTVTLSGSGSDPDADDTLSYAWTQTGEPMVALTDASAATATFTAPSDSTEPVTLTFTLRVTDAGGLFHEDTVTVQTAGVLALNVDAVTGDNVVNIVEKAAGFKISGNTGTEAGVEVKVQVGTGSGAAMLTTTSADDSGTAAWSVTVPAAASYLTGPGVSMSVTASKTGFTSPAGVQRTLTVDLSAPTTPTYTAPVTLKVGAAITAMSPTGDADVDAYSVAGLPAGLSIDTATGVISGTPTAAVSGTATATVTVTDTAANSGTVEVVFPAVAKGDQTLSGFGYSASSVTFGSTAPTVTAPSGAQTTLSYTATPSAVCSVQAATGVLTLAGVGDCEVTATAAATTNYNEATAQYTVTVQTAGVLALNVDAVTGDNVVNIVEKAAGFKISGNTGTEAGVEVKVQVGTGSGAAMLTTTSADDSGTAAWSVTVPAAASYLTGPGVSMSVTASKTGFTSPAGVQRTLTVDLSAPTTPTYTAPVTLKVGAAITAMSPTGDADVDAYSVAGLPAGLSIDTATGVISGTPTAAVSGTATATVTVTDTAANSGTVEVVFPAVAKGDQTLSGFGYSASSVTFGSTAPTVTAPSGAQTTLSYTATPSAVCSVQAATGVLTLAGVGDCEVTATAAATTNYNEATAQYTVTVQTAGVLALNVDAVTGDNVVNIVEKAAGFKISGNTGTEAGVEVKVQVGTGSGAAMLTTTSADDSGTAAWSVTVPAAASYLTGPGVSMSVTASKTGFTSPAGVQRTLTVDLSAPTTPTYTAPVTLKVGAAITAMSPTGDADVDAYSVAGLPAGLSIDTATGVISGTPTAAVSGTATATVTVTDTAANSGTVEVVFPAVAKGDQTLSGFGYSASSVTFGSTAPTVTAPSGAQTTLSYTATPSAVCSVQAATGVLTLAGVGDCEVTATAAATTNYNEATAQYTVTVQTAGVLALNVDAVTGDNVVNIVEKAAGFKISGNTGTEAGVEVKVQVGTGSGAAMLTTTSADDSGTAAWSVTVPAAASYLTGPGVSMSVTASKTGFTSPAGVQRTLTVDLSAPTTPTYTAPVTLKVGAAITAMSPTGDADVDAYSVAGLPAGLSIDTATGVISGTPTAAVSGTATATVTVTDTAANSGTVEVVFPAVAKGDQTLSGFGYSASSVTFGSTAPTVTAPSGAQTTLSYTATPSAVCSVQAATGVLTLAGVGDCEVTATAAATTNYNEATAQYTVTVQTAGVLALNVDAVTGDNVVNIVEKAAGFKISGNTGTEAGVEVKVQVGTGSGAAMLTTTSADDSGTAAWSVTVPAAASYLTGPGVSMSVTASKTGFTSPAGVQRTLTVDLSAPTTPTYTAPVTLKVGAAITAMSPTGDADVDAYSVAGLPAGLSIDTATGVISGTPTAAVSGTATATVTVTDTAANSGTVEVVFPAVAKGDQTLSGFGYSASSVTFGSTAPTVTAPSGAQTTLSYTATPSAVCSVQAATGVLTLAGVGDCEVTATAAATTNYNEATAQYTVTVQTAGVLALNVDAVTGDNVVNIVEKAAGFKISGNTGTEAGVEVKVQVGTGSGAAMLTTTSADDSGTAAWSVTVPAAASYLTGPGVSMSVTASKTGFTSPAGVQRTLTVDLSAPTTPTYTAPVTLKVGAAITAMSPTGDADVDAYSVAGLPAGLSIDTATGVISGTPTAAVSGTATATVTVTDTAANSGTVEVVFPAVAKGDQTLSGFGYSASSVTFGSTAPTVTAPSGAQTTLSYTATPSAVCSVQAATGVLTLAGVGDCEVTATAAATTNYNEATAQYTVTVQTAGVLALNVDAVTGDNVVNIVEKAAGFKISGNTGTEAGVEVKVQVGTGSGAAMLTTTSADDSGTAAWSVTVPAAASYLTGPGVSMSVTASKTGFTSPAGVQRTLTVDLSAPTTPTYTAPVTLKVGAAITAMSPTGDADVDAYSVAGLPAGLSIDTATGVISGTPTAAVSGTATATVTVTDTAANSGTVEVVFPAVAKGDQTLSGFGYSASSVTFGSTAPTVTAPSGAQTTLSYTATPSAVCSVQAATGVLTLAGVGDCEVTATAAATTNYNEATAQYTVTVQTAGVLALNVDAVTGDNVVNIVEKAAGFKISGNTGTEAGVEVKVQVGTGSGAAMLTTTSADDSGTAAWSVTVPAAASYLTGPGVSMSVTASKTGFTSPAGVQRTLTVDLSAPTTPTYTAPVTLKVGAAITAMSPTGDADVDAYSVAGLPAGLSIDTATGVISGTPTAAVSGTATATVTVTDTAANSGTVEVVFPAVAKGDQTLSGFGYSASSVTFGSTAPTVTAPSGAQTTLSYTATPSAVCSVQAATGVLTLAGVGDCEVTATAAATTNYNEATAQYTVTVQTAGVLALNVDAVTGDNVVNIVEKAAGFKISGNTGTEAGVEVKVQVGTGSGAAMLTTTSADDSGTAAWSVTVPAAASYLTGPGVSMSVTASKTGFTSPAGVQRTLTVDLSAPTTPTYTAPVTLKVGAAITAMSPTGDADVDAYSVAGLPAGLSIDTATGVISGTPTAAVSGTATATVTVTDTAANSGTVEVVFPAVAKGDQTLSGFGYSASSVTFGSTAPTVTAPSGAQTTLSYTATPSAVCSVQAATGVLTLAGVGDCEVTATAAATTNYNEATAQYTVTVQTAGVLALNVDAVTGDNVVNIVEKAAGFKISGNTGTEAGVEVKVQVGTGSGAAMLTTTSADDSGTAAWSVTVPAAASYLTGPGVSMSVTASKTGFTSPAGVQRTLTVDLSAPTTPTYTAPVTLKVGAAITAMSPTGDADVDAYSVAGLPAGLSIDTATGVISGTPTAAVSGTATATVTVTDTAANSGTVEVVFPAVAKGDQTLSGFGYSASSVTFGSTAPTVTAPSGAQTTLSYTATPSAVCSVQAATGVLTLAGVGDCEVTATAAATTNYNEATAQYTVTVQTAGVLALNVDAVTGDNVVNIVEKAAGFKISGNTGTEAGVEVKVQVGTGSGAAMLTTTSADDSGTAAWSVTVPAAASYLTGPGVSMSVTASKTGFTSPAGVQRTLTVDLSAPTTPTYTAPVTLKVGAAITAMSPTGDADVDAYSVAGLPAGLSIDTATGVISGTPTAAVSGTATATVTVTDTAANSGTVEVVFPAVAKGDQTLSGFGYSASSVTFGSTAPTVTAPSGAQTTLSYTATPSAVCSVQAATGVLTLAGVGDCEVTATAAATTNYNEATAQYTVTVQTAGVLALNVDAVTGDNVVNIVEKAAGFKISGNTGTEAGVEVKVQVGTGSGAAMLTTTSADDSGTAAWSVTVPAAASYLTGPGVSMSVTASKTGFTSPAGVQRTLTVDLSAPTTPTYTAPVTLKVGAAITAMSPTGDADVDAYSVAGLPAGLSIDTATGVISGTPTAAVSGTATATVTVTDTAANSGTVEVVFPAVAKGDQTLSGFGYSASSVTFGSTAPTVTAPSGAQTTLSYTATPSAVCSVQAATGVLTLAGVGDCEVTATAAATTNYNEATAQYTVTVQTAGVLALNVDAVTGDNVVNIVEKAAGFKISGNTGTEAGVEVKVQVGTGSGAAMLTTTSADDSGTAAWSVTVPAAASYLTGPGVSMSVTASKTGFTSPAGVQRTLTVDLSAPTTPTYTAPVTLKVGAAITAMSPTGDADVDAYSVAGLPAGLSIDTATGVISGTPTAAVSGTATATVTVTDTAANSGTVEVVFPAVAKGDQTLSGFGYSASSVTFGSTAPTVTAPSGAQTTLSYTATPSAVCSVQAATGVLTLAGVGDCEVTATAAATTNYNEATAQYTVTVQTAGVLALNVDAVTGDNVVNIVEKAAGFKISGNTGTEAGVEVKVQVGTGSGAAMLTTTSADDSGTAAWSVTVPAAASYLTGPGVSMSVTASKTGFTSPAGVQRTLTVDLSAPTTPTYTAPVTLKVGAAITAMSPTGDADVDAYSVAGLPAGLSIDTATGVISGTPTAAVSGTATATVTVTDTAANSGTVEVVFPAVAKGDQTLSGFGYSASSVTFGSTAPTVTAPSGAQTTLSYTATPSAVCSVQAATGVLTLAGVGDCEVTATAAATTNYNEATAQYTVTVTAATAPGAPTGLTAMASGNTRINLSWTAPASNGGSAITGYKIEVSANGTSSWTDLVANTGSATTSYAHTGLAAGTTRHYRVSAINSVGTSSPSDIGSATTNTPGIDTSPPVLLRATVNGSTLVLAYNETLESASADAFAVTIEGNAVTVYEVSVSGSVVTLTLGHAAEANQTVTVDYTPRTSPTRDMSGNKAVALSGHSVTNDTPGDGALPRVSIGPWLLIVAEDVGEAVLTVSLSQPAASVLSVRWYTQEATANASDDFTAREDAVVTFAAGESRKTISVRIVDDAVREDPVHDVHELFFVILSGAGEGYILDDHPLADASAVLVEIVDND